MGKVNDKSRPAANKSVQHEHPKPEIGSEEWIYLQAIRHLLFNEGGLLVPTALREGQHDGAKGWVIEVTLRYPTGHEGYIGDLFYDGEVFSFLTPREVRRERSERIAADPERNRLWEEFRASSSRARKR